jgi:hypothetical protein
VPQVRPSVPRISCYAAPDKTACAAFFKGKPHAARQRHQPQREIRVPGTIMICFDCFPEMAQSHSPLQAMVGLPRISCGAWWNQGTSCGFPYRKPHTRTCLVPRTGNPGRPSFSSHVRRCERGAPVCVRPTPSDFFPQRCFRSAPGAVRRARPAARWRRLQRCRARDTDSRRPRSA